MFATRQRPESPSRCTSTPCGELLLCVSMRGFSPSWKAQSGRGGAFIVDQPPHLYRVGIVFPRRPDDDAPWSRFAAALRENAASSLWAPRTVVPFIGTRGHADSEDFRELLNEAKCRGWRG